MMYAETKPVVRVIPGRQGADAAPREVRVAVYCRVSTEYESQESSLENQMTIFERRLKREEGWKLVEVYADKGITGTSLRKRTEFNRMIADCEAGKIDTILTKGISRFARNTVDLLAIVRKLKGMGINVIFDSQNLDTASETSEMLLTILAAMAQEGSQSISDNIRWSNAKRYQMGIVPWSPVYGYTRDRKTGQEYIPDGEKARAVQLIFQLYVNEGCTTLEIMRRLQAEGWPAPGKRGVWYNKAVCNILANEKYRGDALLQKSYVEDLLTHRRASNRHGEKPSYYVEGHHQPLVEPMMFDRAQAIRRLRSTREGKPQYPYAQRLVCPCCGAYLCRTAIAAQGMQSAWFCTACRQFAIRTTYLDEAVLRCRTAHEGHGSKRITYGWLDEQVASITFQGEEICISWKGGGTTTTCVEYSRPRERPQHVAELLRRQWEAAAR